MSEQDEKLPAPKTTCEHHYCLSNPDRCCKCDRVRNSFRQKLLVWIWNLINAVLGGAATAGGAILTGTAMGAATFTHRQVWSTMLAGAAIASFNYVRTNRLPAMFEGDPPEVVK